MAMSHKSEDISESTPIQGAVETETDTQIIDWTTPVGKFKVLSSYYENCNEILSRCKNTEVIYPDSILMDISK